MAIISIIFALSTIAGFAAAQDFPAQACTSGLCNDCPYGFRDTIGYPQCAIYTLEDNPFLTSGVFPAADEGGVEVYMNFPEPGQDCAYILRSPATTQEVDCGQNILTTYNGVCQRVILKDTFLIQFCCGVDDCQGAGAGAPVKVRGANWFGRRAAGSSSMLMVDANGTIIEPSEVGTPPATQEEADALKAAKVAERSAEFDITGNAVIPKRDCVFTRSREPFTAPGDTRVVSANSVSSGTVSLETSQTVGWSQTFSVGITSEIFSIGSETTYEESVTDSFTVEFEVPEGSSGFIVWTPTMRCLEGTIAGCGGTDGETGRGCFPQRNPDGSPVGTTALQVRN